MAQEFPPVVIDNGSFFMKAGFSGDEGPRAVFPTLTGSRKIVPSMVGKIKVDTYVGDEAEYRRGLNLFKYPVQRGEIIDFEQMEIVWKHTFENELRVDSSEHEVLLLEIPLNSKEMKEKMTMSMLETFGVKGVYLANQCVMSLLANGRTTGVVLESGDGVTNIVSVHEGNALPNAMSRLELAGKDLTLCLKELLRERGYHLNLKSELEIVRDIKEQICFVALNYGEETVQEALYELPDGNMVTLGKERCKTTEILFQPHLIEMQDAGIHEQIFNSIRKCDLDVRGELYNNICIAGGSTLFKGIETRLRNELVELSPSSKNIRIISAPPPERKLSNWIGGSIFSQLSTFQSMSITREEYQECGIDILKRRGVN